MIVEVREPCNEVVCHLAMAMLLDWKSTGPAKGEGERGKASVSSPALFSMASNLSSMASGSCRKSAGNCGPPPAACIPLSSSAVTGGLSYYSLGSRPVSHCVLTCLSAGPIWMPVGVANRQHFSLTCGLSNFPQLGPWPGSLPSTVPVFPYPHETTLTLT